jgi:hypothetical protein
MPPPAPGGARAPPPALAGGCGATAAPPRPPLATQHAPVPPRAAAAAPPPDKRSFAAAFGAVTAGGDASKGSRHEDLAQADNEARTFAALDALARREGLHDTASKLTKLKVQAFRCSCGLVSERRRAECAERNHGGGAVSVLKRFFACRACKRRATTLDSAYPARACGGCGATDFDRAPASAAAAGPRLDVHDGVACREALLTRGEEHAFSLKTLR